MRLITEYTQDLSVQLVEQDNGAKQYFISGIFMQSDIVNKNGRIYPFAVLQKEVARYKKEFVDQKRALGELGHPPGPIINQDKVSHLITEITNNGKDFRGKAKIIDTPNGRIVKTFIDEGIRLGVSTRGLGSTRNIKGIDEVQDDFLLATVDIVADPSAPQAFVNGILEGKEWILEGGLFKESDIQTIEKEARKIEEKKVSREIAEQVHLEMFTDLINKCKK